MSEHRIVFSSSIYLPTFVYGADFMMQHQLYYITFKLANPLNYILRKIVIELLIQYGSRRGLNPQRKSEGECSAALISHRHPVTTIVRSHGTRSARIKKLIYLLW